MSHPEVPAGIVCGFKPGFGREVEIVVDLSEFGIVEGVAQGRCGRHHHCRRGIDFICIHLHAIEAYTKLPAPMAGKILRAFEKHSQHLSLGIIKVFDKKHGAVGVINI